MELRIYTMIIDNKTDLDDDFKFLIKKNILISRDKFLNSNFMASGRIFTLFVDKVV